MKVLFLDIDGVLNTSNTKNWPALEPYLVDKFHKWRESASGVFIVLASSWRLTPYLSSKLLGVGVRWYDITPKLQRFSKTKRGEEIKYWLSAHPNVTHYAILDDIFDFLDEQKPYLVLTDPNKGLTDINLLKLDVILELKRSK